MIRSTSHHILWPGLMLQGRLENAVWLCDKDIKETLVNSSLASWEGPTGFLRAHPSWPGLCGVLQTAHLLCWVRYPRPSHPSPNDLLSLPHPFSKILSPNHTLHSLKEAGFSTPLPLPRMNFAWNPVLFLILVNYLS